MGLAMKSEHLLEVGNRGIQSLFDAQTIVDAYEQDPEGLRAELHGRFDEVHAAIDYLVWIPTAADARRYLRSLPRAIRHVLARLYVEVVDTRLPDERLLH